MIDLPSFYEFNIDRRFISFFEKKMEHYKKNGFLLDIRETCTFNGHQTPNILSLNEEDVNEKLTSLRKRLEKKCGVKFEYNWVHMVRYDQDGYQEQHKHDHNEDYSVIVYLNDCDDGSTFYVLNEKRNVIMESIPKRGKCVMFPASVLHGGYPTSGEKKILVLGLRVA